MIQNTWTAVDDYFENLFLAHDPILEAALAASDAAELPPIAVAPNQGKLLMLLIQMCGAKNVLEIGTLGGYSTIWLGRAVGENGSVISLEYEKHHADVAGQNIIHAGLDERVEIIQGAALDTLPTLVDKAPFDFIFIDADKPNNPGYYEWSVKLARSGTIIFLDNVVRKGEVTNLDTQDEKVIGVQQVSELIAKDDRVEAMALQTVGAKGYDGFALIRVK